MHDPYARFHDLNASETRRFAAEAHAETLAQFAGSAEFSALRDDIFAQLQDEKQIPFCQEHRARMYHFHQSEEFPKGVYRVCSAASYRAGMPDWEILFSVADFDEILGDDVYLDGVSHYVEQPLQALLTLSAAGGDAAYTVEFDLANRRIVEGGFHFPAGKNHIAWRDADSVWVCPAWDERQLTASGYPREVWLLRRGQEFSDGLPVFRMEEDGVMVQAWRYLDGLGSPVDLIEAATGFFTKTYYQVFSDGRTAALKLPSDCEIAGYIAGQLLIKLVRPWQRANKSYPAGALVAVKLNKGELGEAALLLAPDDAQAVESVETTKRFIAVSLLDNVKGRLKAWKWTGKTWQEQILPELPQGALELTDQPWGGDLLYIAASDFTTPLTLYALDLQVNELSVLRRQPKQFDADGIAVRQLWARSADGTQIPYFHVGKNSSADTPTLAGARSHLRLGQHTRRRRIQRMAHRRPARTQTPQRGRPAGRRARLGRTRPEFPAAHRHTGRQQRRPDNRVRLCARTAGLWRACVRSPPDRHAGLYATLRRRKLDRGIRRPERRRNAPAPGKAFPLPQPFRRPKPPARTHHHQSVRRPCTPRPRLEVLRQTAQHLA